MNQVICQKLQNYFKEASELKHRAKGTRIPCSNTLGLGSIGEERKKYKQPFEKHRKEGMKVKIITLYTLKLHSVICQLYFKRDGKEKKILGAEVKCFNRILWKARD